MEPIEANDSGFTLSPVWYKRLKWVVQIVLPAFATLYFTVGNQMEWTNVESVMGICAAVATFLGATLGFSAHNYNKGDARFAGHIEITENEDGKKVYNLVVNGDPENIDSMSEATFKVSA